MTTLLDQVPAAFERVRREIVLARFIGKLAVDQGVRELRSRVDELVGGAGASPDDVAPDEVDPIPDDVDAIDPAEESDDPGPQTHVDVASLALADYDQLPASDIVALLEGLEPAERSAIEAYERAGRHRRTILGKLDQLRGEAG
ncbi:MAG: hypothetical protein WBL31_14345 [Ilumatobacteraceae bacterium]|jgi:hypothetical protein